MSKTHHSAIWTPVLAIAAVISCVLPARAAFAWAVIAPPACPTTTNLAWNYRVDGSAGVFDLPSDPNCSGTSGNPCPHYINNLNHQRVFVANSYVSYVGFHVADFSTEPCCDFITWGLEGYTPYPKASGTQLGSGSVMWVNTSWSFEGIRAVLNFSTDYSVTYQGFTLDQIQVCTYLSSPDSHGPNTIDSKKRTIGALLGTGDVVYLQFAASSSYHYPVTLWKDTGEDGTADFDLYGRCNAMPTPTQYDYRSFSSLSQENIDVTGCNGTEYLAIASYNGSGIFSVVRGIHKPSNHRNLTAGTSFNATATQMSQFNTQLAGAAQELYGRTEGEQYIQKINLYNSQSCGSTSCGGGKCDICFDNVSGTGSSGLCSGQIHLDTGYWGNVGGTTHEFVHYTMCTGEEYYNDSSGSPVWQCGHTDMANPWTDNHNLCVDNDHKTDPQPGATPSTLPSGWTQANNAGAIVDWQNTTFDNYNYQGYNFWGNVGSVSQH